MFPSSIRIDSYKGTYPSLALDARSQSSSHIQLQQHFRGMESKGEEDLDAGKPQFQIGERDVAIVVFVKSYDFDDLKTWYALVRRRDSYFQVCDCLHRPPPCSHYSCSFFLNISNLLTLFNHLGCHLLNGMARIKSLTHYKQCLNVRPGIGTMSSQRLFLKDMYRRKRYYYQTFNKIDE